MINNEAKKREVAIKMTVSELNDWVESMNKEATRNKDEINLHISTL